MERASVQSILFFFLPSLFQIIQYNNLILNKIKSFFYKKKYYA